MSSKTTPPPGSNPIEIEVLQGKVVVLEFWATWCRPCIDAIPHMNALVEQFDQDVLFIAVTDEPRETVEPKLDELNMRSWIAFDTDRSVFNNFNVNGIPRTVVIDAHGIVAGLTRPFHLNADKLSRVVRGERAEIGGPFADLTPGKFDWELGFDPDLPRAEIRASATNETSNYRAHEGRITGMAGPALGYAMWAWDIGRSRIHTEVFDSPWTGLFDVAINVPSGDENDAKAAMRELLRTRLGLSIEWADTETETLVLRRSDDLPLRLIEQDRESDVVRNEDTSFEHYDQHAKKQYGWNRRTVEGAPLESLRQYIEDYSWRPVIDETGLEGFYSWSLDLAYTDTQDKAPIVARELGLTLTSERRTVPMLVIKPADPD